MKTVKGFFALLFQWYFLTVSVAQTAPETDSSRTSGPDRAFPAYADAGERGIPLVSHYPVSAYAHLTTYVDNWCVLQDNQGVMVIGNSGGVLLYDGASWRIIEKPGGGGIIRSVDKDAAGNVYAGATNDLGYLAPDSSGRLRFVSLLAYLPDSLRAFDDILKVCATPEGVYFQAEQYLFRWRAGQFKVWKADATFHRAFWIRNQLYVQQPGLGLSVLEGERFRLISADKRFTDTKLQVLLPADDGSLLAGTRRDGAFRFKDNQVLPIDPKANQFYLDHHLYSGIRLPDGTFALATLRGGVAFTDQRGNLLWNVSKRNGLGSNVTTGLALDQQGGLWVTLDRGVDRLDYRAPFTFFKEQNGLQGFVHGITRHHGRLYAGTHEGVFVLQPGRTTGEPAVFQPVPGYHGIVWDVQSMDNALLLATNDGLYELRDGKATLLSGHHCMDLIRSRRNPDRVYGYTDGVLAIQRTPRGWESGIIPGTVEDINAIVEGRQGELWVCLRRKGLLRVPYSETIPGSPAVERYGPGQELPEGYFNAYLLDDQMLVKVQQRDSFRLFEFREDSRRFVPVSDRYRKMGLGDNQGHPELTESHSAQFWSRTYQAGDPTKYLMLLTRQPDGSYTRQSFNFAPFADFKRVANPYLDAGGVSWHGTQGGILRLDPRQPEAATQPFRTLITRINLPADSSIFPTGLTESAVLPFSQRSFRFEFSAPRYGTEPETEYQYQLEGYDDDWSDWDKATYKEYSRIPEGLYTFRVRARTLRGEPGTEAAYTFRIQPPWFRTWPMYVLYGLLLTGLIYLLFRWRLAQLRARNLALEHLVQERTGELATKNIQLAEQTEQLRALDQAKSTFFANISHEFRTPLTLILGNLQDRLDGKGPGTEVVPFETREVNAMHRNARRLLELINQLLDLSKLESGKMQLNPEPGDLGNFFRVLAGSFSSLAESRGIDFRLVLPPEPLHYEYDADTMDKICVNLLSNAFKFTPDGGRIALEVTPLQLLRGTGGVEISVQDSGSGIPAEQQQTIFDRFYQGTGHYSDQQGTGIGLALVRELVQLHGGEVSVNSDPAHGTRFTVQLPLATCPAPLIPEIMAVPQSLSPAALKEEPETAPAAPPAAQDELPLLLIVEDNPDLRAYIRRNLDTRYRVLESENGRLGLATARQQMPDLIITDLMMPDMDGMELCRHIKTDERTSHIPVIMLTALATQESKLKGLDTGADEYLTKPFDARELRLRIRNLVESRRKLQEKFSRMVRVSPKEIAVSSVDEKLLERILKAVEDHMSDPDFGPEELASEVGMSRMQLHRKLTALTGKTTSDFLRSMRLKRAAQLLEARAGNVSEIAFRVGMDNLPYFSRCFKEQFGVTASEYATQQADIT